jgi:hypothetical protein
MFATTPSLLKLEIDKLVFGNYAQQEVRQQDQRKQDEEYRRVPCRYFQIIVLLNHQENDQK